LKATFADIYHTTEKLDIFAEPRRGMNVSSILALLCISTAVAITVQTTTETHNSGTEGSDVVVGQRRHSTISTGITTLVQFTEMQQMDVLNHAAASKVSSKLQAFGEISTTICNVTGKMSPQATKVLQQLMVSYSTVTKGSKNHMGKLGAGIVKFGVKASHPEGIRRRQTSQSQGVCREPSRCNGLALFERFCGNLAQRFD